MADAQTATERAAAAKAAADKTAADREAAAKAAHDAKAAEKPTQPSATKPADAPKPTQPSSTKPERPLGAKSTTPTAQPLLGIGWVRGVLVGAAILGAAAILFLLADSFRPDSSGAMMSDEAATTLATSVDAATAASTKLVTDTLAATAAMREAGAADLSAANALLDGNTATAPAATDDASTTTDSE